MNITFLSSQMWSIVWTARLKTHVIFCFGWRFMIHQWVQTQVVNWKFANLNLFWSSAAKCCMIWSSAIKSTQTKQRTLAGWTEMKLTQLGTGFATGSLALLARVLRIHRACQGLQGQVSQDHVVLLRLRAGCAAASSSCRGCELGWLGRKARRWGTWAHCRHGGFGTGAAWRCPGECSGRSCRCFFKQWPVRACQGWVQGLSMKPSVLQKLFDGPILAAVLLERSFGQVLAAVAHTPTILVWHDTTAIAWWEPIFDLLAPWMSTDTHREK